MGEAGILLVAHTLAPAAWQEERLLEAVRANAESPTLELMWGSPGTMIAAQVLLERTGGEGLARRLARVGRPAAGRSGTTTSGCRISTGAASAISGRHTASRATSSRSRRVTVSIPAGAPSSSGARSRPSSSTAAVPMRLCQWPPSPDPRPSGEPQPIRTQWCHGAPGIVTSFAALAPGDEELTELLVAGGELTWQAGPLAKGAGLCHGTAGNGYAFLKLFERTGDELWLERARAFAGCTSSNSSTDRGASTAAGATRSGREIPARPSTCRTA